jgi:hypothetical protein
MQLFRPVSLDLNEVLNKVADFDCTASALQQLLMQSSRYGETTAVNGTA